MKQMHHELQGFMDKYMKNGHQNGCFLICGPATYQHRSIVQCRGHGSPLLPKFKVPNLEICDRSKDSLEHLETFKAHMTLHEFLGEIMCQVFLLTLKGATRGRFGSLLLGFVDGFGELAHLLLTQFMARRKRRRPVAYLLTVKQLDDESLKVYLSRFIRE